MGKERGSVDVITSLIITPVPVMVIKSICYRLHANIPTVGEEVGIFTYLQTKAQRLDHEICGFNSASLPVKISEHQP